MAEFGELVSGFFKMGPTPFGTGGPWMSSPQANARRKRQEKVTKRANLAILLLHTSSIQVYMGI